MELLNAILPAIQTVAVIVALVYASQQVKEARKGSNLEAIWEIFTELSANEADCARNVVFKNRNLYRLLDEGKGLATIPDEARQNAISVSNKIDRVGYLVYKGLLPDHILLDAYYYMVARAWIALEPYIRYERKRRNRKDYMEFFEYLADLVFKKYIKRDAVIFTD